MNSLKRILSLTSFAFCFSILTSGPLWAGDCTSQDDCQGVPDNGAKTAAGLAALAGGILAANNWLKKQEQDEGLRKQLFPPWEPVPTSTPVPTPTSTPPPSSPTDDPGQLRQGSDTPRGSTDNFPGYEPLVTYPGSQGPSLFDRVEHAIHTFQEAEGQQTEGPEQHADQVPADANLPHDIKDLPPDPFYEPPDAL